MQKDQDVILKETSGLEQDDDVSETSGAGVN